MSEIYSIEKDAVADVEQIPGDKHPVEHVIDAAHSVVSESRDIDLKGPLTADAPDGCGVSPPRFSKRVRTIIEGGAPPFSLTGLDDREGADDEGSEAVTAIHVNRQFSLRTTMKHIVESGQFDGAVGMFRELRNDSDPSAEWLAAYALATFAKGWLAEVFVSAHRDFGKLWVSNDKGGYDLRFKPDTIQEDGQLKSMTLIGSNSQGDFEPENVTIPHWFYQWTTDGLVWSRAERANEMNRKASAYDNRSATNTKKSSTDAELGRKMSRAARLLWWPDRKEL